MKRHVAVAGLGILLAVTMLAFQTSPTVTALDPDTGKVGEAASAKGDNLDKAHVSEIYLTDQKTDTKLEMTGQSMNEIKFKIPKLAAGRYHIMVLTANKASMIEEPVVFTIAE